jgi:hypothetical protein
MPDQVTAAAVQGHWVHTPQEDTDTARVYRRATANLPPMRGGHTGFELQQDGRAVQTRSGPDDQPQVTDATWHLGSDSTLTLKPDVPNAPSEVLRIVSVEPDRLVVGK